MTDGVAVAAPAGLLAELVWLFAELGELLAKLGEYPEDDSRTDYAADELAEPGIGLDSHEVKEPSADITADHTEEKIDDETL